MKVKAGNTANARTVNGYRIVQLSKDGDSIQIDRIELTADQKKRLTLHRLPKAAAYKVKK